MFNRGGFTRGYGPGLRESGLMFPERPNHAGVAVGSCLRAGEIALDAAVVSGDALALRRCGEDIPVKLSGLAGERVKCPSAKKSDRLMRLVSSEQMRLARESFEGENRQLGVSARAVFRVDEPARLRVENVEVAGEIVQRATGKPFDPERAGQQLRRTGGTAYFFESLEIEADPDAFVPVSALNALRRNALEKLDQRRTAVHRENGALTLPVIEAKNIGKPLLYAQASDAEILRKALECGADVAVFCPDDIRSLNTEGLPGRFALALPAVLTDEALHALYDWAKENRERILATFISNVGQLGLDWPGEVIGDFMLNVANDLTAARLNAWGMETFTPSVELTARQIGQMSGRTNLIMWGRIPLMHLRHCPLRAAEGMKGLHADCRHCDVCAEDAKLNGKALVDRRGAAFPLHRIAMPGGCVVQVLNSVPLMPLKRLDRMPEASGWRLLLSADEPAGAVVKVYRAALDGRDFRSMPEWAILDSMNTTTGHYFRGVE